LIPVPKTCLNRYIVYISNKLCPDLKRPLLIGIRKTCFHEDIPHVHSGNTVEKYIPEDSGKPEEILILQPACTAPFIYLYRQFIFSLPQSLCQLKFCRRKAILAVTDECSVQPHIKGSFYPLERDESPFSFHLFFQSKILHITPHRIIAF